MVLVAALFTSGCSWIADFKIPSPDPPGFECRKGPAVADTVYASVTGALALTGMGLTIDCGIRCEGEKGLELFFFSILAVVPGIFSILTSISAASGWADYRQCREDLAMMLNNPQKGGWLEKLSRASGEAPIPASEAMQRTVRSARRATATTPDCPPGTEKKGSAMESGVEVYCVRAGTDVRHGWFMAWLANGTIHATGHYLEGKQDGRWVFLWETGLKRLEAEFKEGNPAGTWIYYNEDGKKLREEIKVEPQPESAAPQPPPTNTEQDDSTTQEPKSSPPSAPRVLRY